MIRVLYRWLLILHPRAFRREFAGEMLWIFDEAAATDGVAVLFYDGLISLARQWLVRSGSWKIVAALGGGVLQLSAAGLGIRMLRESAIVSNGLADPAASLELASLVRLATWLVAGLLVMMVSMVVWVRSFTHARTACRNQALFRYSCR